MHNMTTGFVLDSTAAGTNAAPNISGGHIHGSTMDGGVIYNSGADESNYTMKIDLNGGGLFIK